MEQNSKELNELKQLAKEYLDESLDLLFEGNLAESKEMALRAKDLYTKLDDKNNLAMTLNRLSVIYDEMGDEDSDIKCLLDALELVEDGDDYSVTAKLFNNLGSKFMYLNSYERALECFIQAYDALKHQCEVDPDYYRNNHSFVMILHLNFCTTYYNLGDLENTRKHFELSSKESKYNLDQDLSFVFKCFEGMTYWKLGDKEKALELTDSIVQAAEDTEYATDYLEVTAELIELLKEMEAYDKWEHVLNIIENRLEAVESLYIRSELLKRWLDYYKTTGNIEKYNATCVDFFELSLKKTAEDNATKANMIQLKIDIRRAAKQIKHDDTIVNIDPLTGIGNRNRMLEDSKTYIAESLENSTSLTVGLVDIDFFKECNDTYGHIKGDECLKKVAALINDAVGEAGHVYRYGGDEFLILIPAVNLDEVSKIAETIKNNLATEQIPNAMSPITPYVTISQGYSRSLVKTSDTIEALINNADHILYLVKRKGRNNYRVVEHKDSPSGINPSV